MQKIWKIAQLDEDFVTSFSKRLNIHPITASLLVNRGILEEEKGFKFLNCSLDDLHNPFKMKDMDKAVVRIMQAISNTEKILIHGDYDADGITGVALIIKYLKGLGANICWYIPNRLEEGYGLGEAGVKYAKRNKASLLITIDCGTLAFEPVKELNRLGIDTIIIDHHHPDIKLPSAYAILNPLRNDCSYPCKELAGVGVSFKLCQALNQNLGRSREELFNFLDIVALGTVADVSTMKGENRILVKYGLKVFNELNNVGLKALAEVAGFNNREITPGHISYIFAPRLNASGRLGVADKSLQLLLTEHLQEARKVARCLDDNNKVRQDIQIRTVKEAVQQVEESIDFNLQKVMLLYTPHWHPGVIGIVASKLIEKYYRPTLILTGRGNILQGSGRSIKGFHLYQAVSECRDYLESFGGHEMACGVTLKKENISDFRLKFNEVANRYINLQDLVPSINIDAQIELSKLNMDIIREIENMAPFGSGNPRPVFCSINLGLKNNPQYLKNNGIKLWVTDRKLTCKAIGFSNEYRDRPINLSDKLHIAYSPYIERWQGEESMTLKIRDMKIKRTDYR